MDKRLQEMERYASMNRHVDCECCSNMEDGAPGKKQCTIADDIMFRKRAADKIEAPTIEPMVISTMIGPALVKRILIDCESSVNII